MKPGAPFLFLFLSLFTCSCGSRPLTSYVDPRIGSEGLGRTYIGPCCPFGMVKPSPDCTTSPNSGWLPLPERVDGFSQVHVSGTGGGPKYGNILLMPQEIFGAERMADHRLDEEILPGYYATEFERSGIRVEVTAAERASVYRIGYPDAGDRALVVDLGFFLGDVPGGREAQEFVDSEVAVTDSNTMEGFQTIRGGWNNGGPYTVWFTLSSDRPFVMDTVVRADDGRSLAAVAFDPSVHEAEVRVGISFLSAGKSWENLHSVDGLSFEQVRSGCLARWEDLLGRVRLSRRIPLKYRRMFYTALYHTMLMPSDRTGEWAPAGDEVYYDDYYALWDTYRTSLPLITLLDPRRETELVNSLLTIYRHDGFLPDARSGNCNGRTQGGSTADIVLADAFVKGLPGIDYRLALEAAIKDAEVPPADDEAEGRGGLAEYDSLGYIPWGIPRAGNRTLEYSHCDAAIATLAKGLGQERLAGKYLARSCNWRNLWRAGYTSEGVSGFILPRAADGTWLDDLPYGHSSLRSDTYRYTPTTFEGPWYTPWWSDFFYESDSWEYSLSVPHDVPGLIGACGGPEVFEQRLDRFFDGGHYHVENEPSFLASCLYHWVGRPDKSSERTLGIIARNFDDSPRGLPGNDDSGATSSWLAFHMMGLYPLAGTDLYVVHVPLLRRTVLRLEGGRRFIICRRGLSSGCNSLKGARLNGRDLPMDNMFISHSDIVSGGKLVIRAGKAESRPDERGVKQTPPAVPLQRVAIADSILQTCMLHGQTRRFAWRFGQAGDSLRLDWRIERNLRMWRGSYTMAPEALENGSRLSLLMPEDGLHANLAPDETFAVLPRARLRELKTFGRMEFDRTIWLLEDSLETALTRCLLHARDVREGAEMWVLDYERVPLIWRMKGNPMEVDWECSSLDPAHIAMLRSPDKCGSVFYAYPEPAETQSPAPKGYKPFYISHYGRHGSRYQGSDSRYRQILDLLETEGSKGNLTGAGKDARERFRLLWEETKGHGGELSDIGARQHRGIAARMYASYPELFREGAAIDASSSTVKRCQDSMEAFCDTLLSLQPGLRIGCRSDAATMEILVPSNPEVDSLDSEQSPWRTGAFRRFKDGNMHPGRLFSDWFINPGKVEADPLEIMGVLYYLVAGQQDIPSKVDLSGLLTPEELFACWRCISSRMYFVNTRCPLNNMAAPESVRPLLKDFLDRADAAVEGDCKDAAALRFGHDSILIRLLSLIGVEGCTAEETDPAEFWRAWKDWEISPMAANLQMILFRNKPGDVLVKFLLNETEVSVPGLGPGPFYKWADVRDYFKGLL